MADIVEVAYGRQARLAAVTEAARRRGLNAWKRIDFANLDASWAADVGPLVQQQVTSGQLELARGSDRFTTEAATVQGFAGTPSAVVPQAFTGVDAIGRDVGGSLFGAVTATKSAIATGRAPEQALLTGASYLAAMMKTLIGDIGRASDGVSATGRSFTHYVRVVGGGACSRCAILAGKASGQVAFKRHLNCECTAMPVNSDTKLPVGLHDHPSSYFESLSEEEQDRVFTKAGAQAIRDGADPIKVVNARRGAQGIGYPGQSSGERLAGVLRGHYSKTTIGYRPNGDPVQVYTTSEGTTARGDFGRIQGSTSRVRLMPETINEIAGDDLKLRQAFLRDAGFMDYIPTGGWAAYRNDPLASRSLADIAAQRRADRVLVDRATARYSNFYLG